MADIGLLPAAGVATRARFYRPELDALRFVAFLGVFLTHIMPRDPSWIDPVWGMPAREVIAGIGNAAAFGLPLFFFLSGYLITELLLRERQLTGRFSLRGFWLRRILRIWPLYAFGLAVGSISHLLWRDPADDGRMLAYTVMLGNWFCIHHGWSQNPMVHLWSISVEEQFYLLWPLLLLLPRPLVLRMPLLFVAISAATLVYLASQQASPDTEIWWNSFVQLAFLGGGAAVALWRADTLPTLPGSARWPVALVALAAWFVAADVLRIKAVAPADGAAGLIAGYALVLAGCAALFFAVLGARVPRWAAWLGRISYGLYVFHWMSVGTVDLIDPTLRDSNATPQAMVRAALGLAITVAIAAVSYYGLERPFLRLKDRFARIATRPA